MFFTFFMITESARVRRATEFRQAYSNLIPRNMPTFSPMRDNVVAMVASGMKTRGMTKGTIKSSLEAVFTHGCHCGWYTLSDKSQKPNDRLDQICLDFDHCSECNKMDGCNLETGDSFSPRQNGTSFTCDHLTADSCQYNMCLCSTNMAKLVTDELSELAYSKLTFTEFMDECVAEVDASINTQMGLGLSIFGALRGLAVLKERQCCGAYPQRKAFTYTGPSGMACCADDQLFDQKHMHCCPSGALNKVGDVCW